MRGNNGGAARGARIAPAAGDHHTARHLPPSGVAPGALTSAVIHGGDGHADGGFRMGTTRPAGDRHTAQDQPPGGAPPGALKTPRSIAVEAEVGLDGPLPRWVVWRGRRRRIAEIVDEWRVDDEWWRAEVRRHYFAVLLADGSHLTVFCDLLEGTWWEQRY